MKTVKIISLVVSVIVLTSAITAGTLYLLKPNPIEKIKTVVSESLNDPDSARFSKVTYNSKTGYGCGLVNARNKLGGYAGNKRFVASLNGKVIFDPEKKAPSEPAERSRRLTLPSSSVYGMTLDVLNDANATLERGREINAWIEASRSARAENEAFQDLVDSKCLIEK